MLNTIPSANYNSIITMYENGMPRGTLEVIIYGSEIVIMLSEHLYCQPIMTNSPQTLRRQPH